MLTFSGRVDRLLQGWRARIVVGVAGVVVVGPLLDDTGLVVVLSPVLFVVVLAVLAGARLDALRDEAGRWPKGALSRLLTMAADWFQDRFFRFRDVPAHDRARLYGKTVAGLGVCSTAIANIVGTLFGTIDELVWGGWVLILAGVMTWALGRWRHSGRPALTLSHNDAAGADEVAVRTLLPAVLDCRDPESVLRAAASIAHHHAIATVLRSLANWRPRPRYDDEREYHDKFYEVLRRALPDVDLKYEHYIAKGQRVDIVLGDGKPRPERGVLVEMKAHLSGSEADRLHGQAGKYMAGWHGKGALVLVTCRSDERFASRLEAIVTQLRGAGYGVVAVLAAPKPMCPVERAA
jgi:hypothetical protein